MGLGDRQGGPTRQACLHQQQLWWAQSRARWRIGRGQGPQRFLPASGSGTGRRGGQRRQDCTSRFRRGHVIRSADNPVHGDRVGDDHQCVVCLDRQLHGQHHQRIGGLHHRGEEGQPRDRDRQWCNCDGLQLHHRRDNIRHVPVVHLADWDRRDRVGDQVATHVGRGLFEYRQMGCLGLDRWWGHLRFA